MQTLKEVKVNNSEENHLISELIKNLNDVIRNDENVLKSKIVFENKNGEKDTLLISLLLSIPTGIATAFLYEYLKTLINNLKSREDFDYKLIIEIDGDKITLDEILKK